MRYFLLSKMVALVIFDAGFCILKTFPKLPGIALELLFRNVSFLWLWYCWSKNNRRWCCWTCFLCFLMVSLFQKEKSANRSCFFCRLTWHICLIFADDLSHGSSWINFFLHFWWVSTFWNSEISGMTWILSIFDQL